MPDFYSPSCCHESVICDAGIPSLYSDVFVVAVFVFFFFGGGDVPVSIVISARWRHFGNTNCWWPAIGPLMIKFEKNVIISIIFFLFQVDYKNFVHLFYCCHLMITLVSMKPLADRQRPVILKLAPNLKQGRQLYKLNYY